MYRNNIGINAGVIWHLLSEKGGLTIRQIGELTSHKELFIILSLGWLAKENKIVFKEENGEILIELNKITSDMYY